MKKILLSLVMVMVAFGVMAQARVGRVDTRVLIGVKNNVQDEFDRNNRIIFIQTNSQPVLVLTNSYEGVYMVMPTNAQLSAAFTIGIPNPTNNYPRHFTFITPDGSHIVLSNAAGGFTDLKTMGVSNVMWLVTSNKVTDLYSTGTNWAVKSR